MNRPVSIISGNFATGVDSNGVAKKGNFTGYDEEGERYFIHKTLMNNKGWDTDKKVQFPFWAKTKINMIGQLDKDGKPVTENGLEVKVARPQVMSIFKTFEEVLDLDIKNRSYAFIVEASVQAKATSLGLDKASIDLIASAQL